MRPHRSRRRWGCDRAGCSTQPPVRSGRSRTRGCCRIRAGDRVGVRRVRRGRSLAVDSPGIQLSDGRDDEQISDSQAIGPGDPAPIELPEGLAIALGSIVEPGDAREAFPGSDGVLTGPGGYRPGSESWRVVTARAVTDSSRPRAGCWSRDVLGLGSGSHRVQRHHRVRPASANGRCRAERRGHGGVDGWPSSGDGASS